MESKVQFVARDMPEATPFMLHIYAAVAQEEARAIGARTKAALAAAKARGVRLGRHGAEVLAPQYREEARQRAVQLQPVITELKGKGLSLAKIAGELNKRKVATPRGGPVGSLVGAECAAAARSLNPLRRRERDRPRLDVFL